MIGRCCWGLLAVLPLVGCVVLGWGGWGEVVVAGGPWGCVARAEASGAGGVVVVDRRSRRRGCF